MRSAISAILSNTSKSRAYAGVVLLLKEKYGALYEQELS
jgi:hypothetical protein